MEEEPAHAMMTRMPVKAIEYVETASWSWERRAAIRGEVWKAGIMRCFEKSPMDFWVGMAYSAGPGSWSAAQARQLMPTCVLPVCGAKHRTMRRTDGEEKRSMGSRR